MADIKTAGLLLHLSSFPNHEDAIGTPGATANALLEKIHQSGLRWLQVLPLGPVGPGNSPYASTSAFAMEPLLIDLTLLKNYGLLEQSDLDQYHAKLPKSANKADFNWLQNHKPALLHKAWLRFSNSGQKQLENYIHFQTHNEHWLPDFALFSALKEINHNLPWYEWPEKHRFYKKFLQIQYEQIDHELTDLINFQIFLQFTIQQQWDAFKANANKSEIQILGDCPIFVSHDSADVWAHPELFSLNENLECEFVAGVPPDYFSELGQRWGNPLYDWQIHKDTRYTWWTDRLLRLGHLCDSIRIDHFRGFDEYWAIPTESPDARQGSWQPGPGMDFFNSIAKQTDLPAIIAEDLGIVTDSVRQLLKDTKLPGMRIFEFAPWGQASFEKDGKLIAVEEHEYLPENWPVNCVGYPGTHDNDTLQGWYHALSEEARNALLLYLDLIPEKFIDYPASDSETSSSENDTNDNETTENKIPKLPMISSDYQAPVSAPLWPILERLFAARARLVIVALQDLLLEDSSMRMNTPGTCNDANWSYRMNSLERWDTELISRLKNLIHDTHR